MITNGMNTMTKTTKVCNKKSLLQKNKNFFYKKKKDETSNTYCGEQALDRLSIALGGKQLVPILMNLLSPVLQSQDWKHRHTGEFCYFFF